MHTSRSWFRRLFIACLLLLSANASAEMQKFIYAYDSDASLVTPKNAANQCPDPNGGTDAAQLCQGVRVAEDGTYSFRIDKDMQAPDKLMLISNEYEFVAKGSRAGIDRDSYFLIESRRRVESIQPNKTNKGVDINTLSETIVQALEKNKQVNSGKKGAVSKDLSKTLKVIDPEKLNAALGNAKQDNSSDNKQQQQARNLINSNQEKLSAQQQQTLLDVATLAVDNPDNDELNSGIRKNVLQAVTNPVLLSEVSHRVYSHVNRIQNQASQTPSIFLESDRYLIHKSETTNLTTANSLNPQQFFAYTWQGVDSETSTASYHASESGSFLVCVSGEIDTGNDSSTDCVRLLVQEDAYALARANRHRTPIGGDVIFSADYSVGANSYAWSGEGHFASPNSVKSHWIAPSTPGTYTIVLTINGTLTDSLDIEVFDVLPVAIAETSRDIIVLGDQPEDDSATLRSVSVTTDGSVIDRQHWQVIDQPVHAIVRLDDADAVNTIFSADLSGLYTLRLTVYKGTHEDSAELQLRVTVAGAPVAVAGPDRITYRNEALLLDGTRSYDPDDKPLQYQWLSANASIESVRQGIARFTSADMGQYKATLTVANDTATDSDSINIDVINRVPVSSDDVINANIQEIVEGQLRALDGDQDPMLYSLVTAPQYGGVTIDPNTGTFLYIPGDVKGCRYQPYARPHANQNGGLDVPVIKLCADKYIVAPGDTVQLTTSNSINASRLSGYEWSEGAVADSNDIRLATWNADEEGLHKVCVTGNIGQSNNTSTACVEIEVDANAAPWRDAPVSGGYTDRFQFRVHDGFDNSNTATIILTIGWSNNKPVVTDVQLQIEEDVVYLDGQLNATDIDGHALRFEISQPATKGSATITNIASGTFTYLPGNNATGNDSFKYRVFDGYEYSAEGTVTVTINPVNDLPVAYFSGILSTITNTPVSATLGARDPDDDTLTFILTSQPKLGAVTLDSTTGALTYTPDYDVIGQDSFTFLVNDGSVNSNIVTVPVVIEQRLNHAPVAENGLYIIDEEQPLSATLSASDEDGDNITYSISTTANMGTVTLSDASSGAFTYTPDSNAVGTDTFYFKASDGEKTSIAAEVRITIAQVNDAPVAQAASFETYADETLQARAIATDVDTDTLSFEVSSNGNLGTLTFAGNGTGNFTYIPHGNQTGTDTIHFLARDHETSSNTGILTIVVNKANLAPLAHAMTIRVHETVAYRALLTATDADSDTFTFSIVDKPQQGVVLLENDQDGSFKYIADKHTAGKDSFTFKVDDGNKVSTVAKVSIDILSVDSLCDGPLNIAQDADNDGYADFIERAYAIPADDFSLTPQALIDQGSILSFTDDDDLDAYADFAEVWLGTDPMDADSHPTFSEQHELPACLRLGSDTLAPSVLAFQVLTPILDLSNGEQAAKFALSIIDNVAGTHEVSVRLRSPAGVEVSGTLTLDNNPRVFAGILSTDLFSQYAEAGIWTIEELKILDALKNTTILDNALLRALNYPAMISVINANSDLVAPTLESLNILTPEFSGSHENAVSIDVGATDNLSGVKQIKLALRSPSGEYHWGSAQLKNGLTAVNETIEFQSIGAFAEIGTWEIAEIEILDVAGNRLHLLGQQLQEYGFTIQLNCIGNTADTSKPELISLDISTPVIDLWTYNLTGISPFEVLDSGSGIRSVLFELRTPSGQLLSSSMNNLSHSLSWQSDYRHEFNRRAETGLYRINRILIDDVAGNRASYSTSELVQAGYPTEILVRASGGGFNNRPVAYDARLTVLEDNELSSMLNAADADGDNLTYVISTATQHGSVRLTNPSTGAFSYTPNKDFYGNDQFNFVVDDGYSESQIATVEITVDAVNDKPVAEDLSIITFEDTAFDGTLKGSDVDSTALTYQIHGDGVLGSADINPSNGTFRYTPNAGATGSDSFSYTVSDGQATSLPATVEVTITSTISLKSFTVVTPVVNSYIDGETSAISWEIELSQEISNFREVRIELVGPSGEVRGFLSTNFSGLSGPLLTSRSYSAGDPAMELGTWHFRNIRVVKNNEVNKTFNIDDIAAEGFSNTLEVVRGGSTNAPVAQGDSITVFESVPYVGQLHASDNDSTTLSYQQVDNATAGTVVINSQDGQYTYTPTVGASGGDRFSFSALDESHISDPANININIISTDELCAGSSLVINADRDHDGYANILEQAFNTDPDDANATPAGLNATDLGISFRDDDDNDQFNDISEFWLGSLFNNALSVPTRSLARGLPNCFNPNSDGIKPWLLGYKLLTPTINVVSGDETARFALSMVDNASGIRRVRLNLISPAGMFITSTASFDHNPLIHGVELETAAFGAFAESGTWHVASITLYDAAGNRRTLDRTALEDSGYSTAIEVSNNNSDTTPPQLDDFSINSVEIYPGAGNASMSFDVSLSDNSSGVSSARIDVVSPSGTVLSAAATLADAANQVILTLDTDVLSEYTEAGAWMVYSLIVVDHAGNSIQLVDRLWQLGYNIHLNVTNPNSDASAPMLTGFNILTPQVNPLSGDARFSFAVSALDDLSGINKVRIDLIGPSGQYIEANGQLSTQTVLDASMQLDTATLNAQLETGQWTIVGMEVFDNAGNSLLLTDSELAGAGYSTNLNVAH